MFKRIAYLFFISSSILTVPLFSEEKVSTFPTEVTASELSQKQKAQAGKNLDAASKIYSEILDYNNESKAESIKRNLDFVKKALIKANDKFNLKKKNLSALKNLVLARSESIEKIKRVEIRDKKKAELLEQFSEQKDYLEFEIGNLKKRVERLESRKAILKGEYEVFSISAESSRPKKQTWKEIDAKRTKEANSLFENLKSEKVNQRYDKYNDED